MNKNVWLTKEAAAAERKKKKEKKQKLDNDWTYPSPAEGPGQIVTGAQGQDTHRRCGTDSDLIQDGQDPSGRSVSAAGQHSQIGHLAEHFQTATRGFHEKGKLQNEIPVTEMPFKWKKAGS